MAGNGIRMYGTAWCGDCKRAKRFLGEQRVPYEYVDIEDDPEGQRIVEEINQGKRIIPTIFFPDGSVLVEPTNAQLAEKLGLQTKPKCPLYDLVVVGGGPAALTAAIYCAREGIDTLVVERSSLGGQAGITECLDNYPGFPEGITGAEFAERVIQQAGRFGVELLSAADVKAIGVDGDQRWVQLAGGDEVRGMAILLAPGTDYKRLGVPGERDFLGAGVHYCATCDGPFYKGEELLVVGGGNSAVEEGLFLTKFASKVTIATLDSHLTASKTAQDMAMASPQVELLFNTTVAEFKGDKKLRSVTMRNAKTGETWEAHPGGVFVFIGLRPNTRFLAGTVDLDDNGFIRTSPTLETSLPGVFAAGDARQGSTKQLVSAAGEGATAALMIRQYLEKAKMVATHQEDLPAGT